MWKVVIEIEVQGSESSMLLLEGELPYVPVAGQEIVFVPPVLEAVIVRLSKVQWVIGQLEGGYFRLQTGTCDLPLAQDVKFACEALGGWKVTHR